MVEEKDKTCYVRISVELREVLDDFRNRFEKAYGVRPSFIQASLRLAQKIKETASGCIKIP